MPHALGRTKCHRSAWVALVVTLSMSCMVSIAAGLDAATDDLLCPHPADALPADSELRRLHAAFDAVSERRIFSEIHYIRPGDPHLTIGMGHWTYANLIELFRRLHAEAAVWQEVRTRWHAAMTPPMWSEFEVDTGVSDRSEQALERGLRHVLCLDGAAACERTVFRPWTHRRGVEFNGAENWFHAGWLRVARLHVVGEIQVRLWLDTVVLPAEADARRVGASTLGGVASLASARSSSPGIARRVAAKVDSTLQAPSSARPVDAGNVDEARLLRDWKSVVAWNEYNRSKKDIRSRMRAIWRAYFEQTWGKMPRAVGDLQSLKHSGCYMPARPIDSTVGLAPAATTRCTTGVPTFTSAECSR